MQNIIQDASGAAAELRFETLVTDDVDYLREIGPAGLVFASTVALEAGAAIFLRIPLVRPVLEAKARVAWCRPEQGHFIVGVEFPSRIDRFRARMVQQVCRIEHYRKTLREREGRELSRQEAALEWISKYAHDFPGLEDFPTE